MFDFNAFKQELNKGKRKYTDEEAKLVMDWLQEVAAIHAAILIQNRNKENEKSSSNVEGIERRTG